MQSKPTAKPLIILLGQTGSGKSTFISTVGATSVLHPGQTPEIGHGLSSCTKDLEEYIYSKDNGKSVQLVDTPGFDDDELSQGDCDKLGRIIDWLEARQVGHGPVLIIYLLDINQCRLTTSSGTMSPTKISRPPGVVFVTTKWSQINGEELQNREKLLRNQFPDCQLKSFNGKSESARKILEEVCFDPATMTTKELIIERLRSIQKGLPLVPKDYKGIQKYVHLFIKWSK